MCKHGKFCRISWKRFGNSYESLLLFDVENLCQGCSRMDHMGPYFDILFNSTLSLSRSHWIVNKKKIDNILNRKKQSKTIIVIICMSRGYCTTRIIFASKLLVERKKTQLNIAY